jgi:hypothetical protein
MAKKSAPPMPGIAPPPWNPQFNRHVRLWHGTLNKHATKLLSAPAYVRHNLGRSDTDFGLGFYTTTIEQQARQWAWLQHFGVPFAQRGQVGNLPVVVWFRVQWARLADLASLALSVSDSKYDPYWSLVFHCRSSPPGGPANHHCYFDATGAAVDWYDTVSGPVAAMWRQRVAMPDTDQISFHTQRGVDVLNDLIRHGVKGSDYDVLSVP